VNSLDDPKTKLRETIQLDLADLDFGIYCGRR